MIRWKPEFAIGIPLLDDQHQSLFEYAARLQDAVDGGDLDHRVQEILGYLTEHVAKHFEEEERLMRETGYPGLAEQEREHEDFKRRLVAFTPDWESEADHSLIIVALVGLLDFWFVDHMNRRDRGFGEYLRSNGRDLPGR
jgi:hemerythrin